MTLPTKLHPLWSGFTYFEHQKDGIHWMLEKEINGTSVPNRNYSANVTIHGGFQCDDMGLGKTIQITSVIINNPCRFTLLFAPLAMIDTWTNVLIKAGCLCYQVDTKTKSWKIVNDFDEPIPKRFSKARPAVYITNYEKMYNSPSLFGREWDRIVLDEAHKIRNGDGQLAKAARKIVAPIRWVVTGTPLVNSFKDVVSLLAFLGVPYSPLWRWESRYLEIMPKILIHRSLDELRSTIKDAPPIPEIHNIILPFDTKDEEEFYLGIQDINNTRYFKESLTSIEAFKLLLRLRQLSVHPQIYINAKRREDSSYSRPNWTKQCTKIEKIKQLIRNDSSENIHKYIIFCQFNDEMAIIREALLDSELVSDNNILLYNGSMTQKEREIVLRRSKESAETTVMLLQLQAGGVGLNLQEYDRVIFVSPWWTSALMDQAIARAVRMGQKECVKVYHLQLAVEHDTSINIDRLINAKAGEKQMMLDELFAICSSLYD
jgi:SNF2 family DNA or RNA helicase